MVDIPAIARSGRQQTTGSSRSMRTDSMGGPWRIVHQLFSGTSVIERRTVSEGRKAARFEVIPQDCPSTRTALPHLLRASTAPATLSIPRTTSSTSAPSPVYASPTSRPITPNSLRDIQRTMSLPLSTDRTSSRPFVGVDPEEQYLADLAARGRRRQSKRSRAANRRRSCVVNFKNRKVRSKVIACCLSAIFLMTILAIYLALTLTNREESQEFHVILILIILLTTIFFCHSLISLCMVAVRCSNEEDRPRMSLIGPGGFANPTRPIAVALARDEEAAGIESEATKFPPPAYGLWRESVRVDPNRIYWQRAETRMVHSHQLSEIPEPDLQTQRPPSYVSEDGVAYVIEAAPRSIAPADVPMRPPRLGR